MPDDPLVPPATPETARAADELHPRPQLVRRRWTELDGRWEFAYDDEDSGRSLRYPSGDVPLPLTIVVPYPPESPLGGIGDRSFHPVVWYRRTFTTSGVPDDERLLLHFGAVDYRAEVWVNGHLVARHEGGHTPFSADITDVLRARDAQVVVVRAEDRPTDLSQPRGKQDFQPEPHNVWYERTTGIWQPVWLEPVPVSRVGALRLSTDLDRGVIGVHATLVGARPGMALTVEVALRGELIASETRTVTAETTQSGLPADVVLPRARLHLDREQWLWSPEHPNLMDLAFTLRDERGRTLDDVSSYVGVRSVEASGGRFLLNGRPYFLRLVLAQNYWPESHLAAPSAQALRREVELARDLGFNGVRLHQKVEDPRFLYWCDRLGLAVWAELPAAFAWTPTAAARSTREWLEVLERDVGVPSILAWVPVNESWGVPALRTDPTQRAHVAALYWLAKALDGSRPVVGNDGWEHVATDVITIHDYAGDGATLRERYGSTEEVDRALAEVQPLYRRLLLPDFPRSDQPVLLSEFGGISFLAGQGFWNGYGTADDEEQFLRAYRDLLDAVLDSPVLAGFCYTQLTDTAQERNGLLNAARVPKADLAKLATVTRRHSAAVPADIVHQHQTSPTRTAVTSDEPRQPLRRIETA